MSERGARIVVLVDWLPPDFGAVGQYALARARELAATGNEVALVGFSSARDDEAVEAHGSGRLRVRRIRRAVYDRTRFWRRATWTLRANFALLWRSRDLLRWADEIRFTGSPPYLLHFVVPAARVLGKRTRYRITDFHPECLIAALSRTPLWLRLLLARTRRLRRRVDVIEVLGEDQRRRIAESGVELSRIVLARDPSPVSFEPAPAPALPPEALRGRPVVLYSGNWGVAHDSATFVEGFARYARRGGRAGLWLNATGARVDAVESALRASGALVARTQPVALDALSSVLRAADLHLITLDDRFVGYVLPSKVYACIASGRPVLYVGPRESDVHALCAAALDEGHYRRVDTGDADGVMSALEALLPPTRTEAEAAA